MKPRVILFHGYKIKDGGAGTTDRLRPYFEEQGFEVLEGDYGKTHLWNVRQRNEETVAEWLPKLRPTDILVGHSNGCLVIHMLIERGAKVAGVICIQPALRTDTEWREDVRVLCTFNTKDWVVRFLGRAWGRFISVAKPWGDRHGWGAAGYHGFKNKNGNVLNIDIDVPPAPAPYHSGLFETTGRLAYWSRRFGDWAYAVLALVEDAELAPVQ